MSHPFKKQAKHREACDVLNRNEHALLYGGSRSGKTTLAVRNIILRGLKRQSRHLITRYRFNHAKTSIEVRSERVEAAKIAMGYELLVVDRVDLFNSIQLMVNSYVNTNDATLTTWMHSPSGFKEKSYYTSALEGVYTEIAENGIY